MDKLKRRVVIALCLVAFALRLWGIAFGLPYPYHPDEPAFVLQALAIARGLPNGLTFANPPLFKYVLLVQYALTFALGRLGGLYTSPQDFVNQFRADPTLLYLSARVTSAAFGALTTAAVYALASRVGGSRVALLAAGMTAATYLLVRESHFAVNDALLALVTTCALYASLRVLQDGARRDYLLAGAAVGLSFSAKYTGLITLVPMLLAHAVRVEPRTRDLLYTFAAAALITLLTFPSLAFETAHVLNDNYIHLYRPAQIGYGGMDVSGGYVYYLKVLAWGMGLPLLAAAVLGILVALRRTDRPLLVVSSLPLALVAVMGYERMYFARFILPAVPALLVLAAASVDALNEKVPQHSKGFALAAALLVLCAPTLLDALRFDHLLTQTDTRTLAREWIGAQLPSGAHVASDVFPFAPVLPSTEFNLLIANGWSLDDFTVDDYSARGVEYLVTSSYLFAQPQLDGASDARRQTFYADLHARAEMITEFRPQTGEPLAFVYDQLYAPFTELDRLTRPGPTLVIYRLPRREVSR